MKPMLYLYKTSVIGNEELRPFIETPKLILTFNQIVDICFLADIDEK